jgi:HD-like signal output (HDOD) protein
MKSGELKRFSGSLKDLPTLPQVAIKLIEITRDKNSSFQHVARIIETDQTLTSVS